MLKVEIQTSKGNRGIIVTTEKSEKNEVILPILGRWTLLRVDLNALSQNLFKTIDSLEISGESTLGALFSGSVFYELENLPACINFSNTSLLEWKSKFDLIQVPNKLTPST